jgi:transposase
MPDLDDLVRLNESGKTTKEIAVIYGVHVNTVRRWFSRNGLAARRDLGGSRGLSAERRREIGLKITKAQMGKRRSLTAKIRKAETCERLQLHISPVETLLADMLRERGIPLIQQKAIGPYNVDIATGAVAVEVFGGGWHNTRREGERLRYLFDRGWDVVIIWVDARNAPLTPAAAEYVISHLQFRKSNPTAPRCYRVIRGTGQLLATGSANSDDLPDVVTARHRLDLPESIPEGHCQCGCGERTSIAPQTHTRNGWVAGKPMKFVLGHSNRGRRWTVGEDGRRKYTS